MLVLGCDPSLTDYGWTVLDMSKKGDEILVDAGRIRTKAKEFFVVRYARLRNDLCDVMDSYDLDYVSIEKPPHNASWSAGLYPIWIATAESCFDRRTPFATFLPTQIKAYARGILDDSGKMFKSDMIFAAKQMLDYKGKMNHNIADAILIGLLGYRLKGLIDGTLTEDDLSKKEKYLLTRTVTKRATGNIEKLGALYKEGDAYYNLRHKSYDHLYEDE